MVGPQLCPELRTIPQLPLTPSSHSSSLARAFPCHGKHVLRQPPRQGIVHLSARVLEHASLQLPDLRDKPPESRRGPVVATEGIGLRARQDRREGPLGQASATPQRSQRAPARNSAAPAAAQVRELVASSAGPAADVVEPI